jgi:hypothetical protein
MSRYIGTFLREWAMARKPTVGSDALGEPVADPAKNLAGQ